MVVEISYRDGSIVKAFALGDRRGPIADDFEGIAAAEGRIYLVSSLGQLYEFDEGADEEAVPYNRRGEQTRAPEFLLCCKKPLAVHL